MRTTAEFLNTDSYEVAITIRMSLGDWKKLRQQLADKWPSWDLASQIRDVVTKAEATVHVAPPSPDTDK